MDITPETRAALDAIPVINSWQDLCMDPRALATLPQELQLPFPAMKDPGLALRLLDPQILSAALRHPSSRETIVTAAFNSAEFRVAMPAAAASLPVGEIMREEQRKEFRAGVGSHTGGLPLPRNAEQGAVANAVATRRLGAMLASLFHDYPLALLARNDLATLSLYSRFNPASGRPLRHRKIANACASWSEDFALGMSPEIAGLAGNSALMWASFREKLRRGGPESELWQALSENCTELPHALLTRDLISPVCLFARVAYPLHFKIAERLATSMLANEKERDTARENWLLAVTAVGAELPTPSHDTHLPPSVSGLKRAVEARLRNLRDGGVVLSREHLQKLMPQLTSEEIASISLSGVELENEDSLDD